MFFKRGIALPGSIVLLSFVAQCHAQSLPPVAGTIRMSAGWKPVVYLVQPRYFSEIAASYTGVLVDSVAIDAGGHFAFSRLRLDNEKTFFQICLQPTGSRFPNQLLDDDPETANYMPLVLQKGTSLDIEASADRLQATFSIKQVSEENRLLLHLRDIRRRAHREQKAGLSAEVHTDEAALLEHEAALSRFRQPLMAFADTCSVLWPALVAVRWVSPAGDFERVPEFLFGQCQKWQEKTPGNPWAAQLCQAGDPGKLPVLTGDTVPDYALPMATGDTLILHTLLGSRLTVLDIWASWCAPCRRENREVLAPLWGQYREKGLQIIGYSIDSSPAPWEAAIAKDGAAWPHASHLSGDTTPFLEALRITTIPANFILDDRGKVLAKNLHGEALKSFVDNFLNQ